MHTQSSAKKKYNAAIDDFFVPELCQPEALLSMVLLAELLVLVLVLAEPMTPVFDWVRLALTSLFVQWIVLLSAAVLCRLRPLLARLRPALAPTQGFARHTRAVARVRKGAYVVRSEL